MAAPLLTVKNLVKYYPIYQGILFRRQVGAVKAVDGLNFEIKQGETFGLVGESGCGKSTTGRLILRLLSPTSGEIFFEGKNILTLKPTEMRELRKQMQIIFQDPYASLNPRMTIADIIAEPLIIHKIGDRKSREKRVKELLEVVGLSSYHARRYPHEFSGGQRQRICIAKALALKPKLIVCDEPVSALDVSIQAQVINLMQSLQKQFGLTYLFISHNLSVVKHISNRVAVMYLGKIVEIAGKRELYARPLHPYTEALLSAVPVADPTYKKKRIMLEGDVPSPINTPPGCCFHTRCKYTTQICMEKEPALLEIGKDHFVACHRRSVQIERVS
ncbi:MAG: dipeptide ABC transporter ATP-binding protein [Firmicutes bacterium]|nr:dipeptide ABC transporter ATP-binding protein [Bacillota bacterium]